MTNKTKCAITITYESLLLQCVRYEYITKSIILYKIIVMWNIAKNKTHIMIKITICYSNQYIVNKHFY